MIFGDELALRYVVTPTTDKVLLVPMTYAAITGILVLVHRVAFANKRHRTPSPASVIYIAGERAAARLLLVCDLGRVGVDLVPDVVQLPAADRGVSGVPDNVLAAAV